NGAVPDAVLSKDSLEHVGGWFVFVFPGTCVGVGEPDGTGAWAIWIKAGRAELKTFSPGLSGQFVFGTPGASQLNEETIVLSLVLSKDTWVGTSVVWARA